MAEFNRSFYERGQDIVWIVEQADANTDITGDWVKAVHYTRIGILLTKLGTEDVDDLGLQLLQATSAAGGSSKALSLPQNSLVMTKSGTFTSATTWTRTLTTAAIDGMAFGSSVPTGFTRVIADVNTDALQLYAEFEVTALDVDNGFDWVTCFIEGDNVNNACLVSVQAILMGGRFPQATPLSCIS